MKKAIMIIMVVLMSAGVSVAEEKSVCENLAMLAGGIMNARQRGVDIFKTMKIVKADDNIIIKRLVITAYERPWWHGKERQQRAVVDFKNQAYLECYKAIQK